MSRKIFLAALVFLFSIIVSPPSHAAEQNLHYQGRLRLIGGALVNGVTRYFKVSYYDSQVGGSLFWADGTCYSSAVSYGVFELNLNTVPANLNYLDASNYWMTLQMYSNSTCTTLLDTFPREQLSASPVAITSSYLSGISGTGTNILGDARIGFVTDDNGSTASYGNRLYFSGGDDWAAWNSDNSDPIWLGRYNVASDQSELRLNVGDGASGTDKLNIGTTAGGVWDSNFLVEMDGDVALNDNARINTVWSNDNATWSFYNDLIDDAWDENNFRICANSACGYGFQIETSPAGMSTLSSIGYDFIDIQDALRLYTTETRIIRLGETIISDIWGADGASDFVIHSSAWDGSSNSDYGDIIGDHYYSYGGIDVGSGSGAIAGGGQIYVQGTSKLNGSVAVGLGSTDPWAKVDIFHNSNPPHIRLVETANDYARLELRNSDPVNSEGNYWHIAGYTHNTPSSARLNFYYSDTGGDVLSLSGDKKATFNGTIYSSLALSPANGSEAAITRTNAKILLYDYGANNWAGIAVDTAGDILFRTGTASTNLVTITAGGAIGIGTAAPGSYKLNVNGTMYATSYACASDENLKKDIEVLDGQTAIEKLKQINGVNFKWREGDESLQLGVIAQDVEKVFPEAVITDENTGFKSVNYDNLVAPLIEAVKEQQKQIEELQNEVNYLKDKVGGN